MRPTLILNATRIGWLLSAVAALLLATPINAADLTGRITTASGGAVHGATIFVYSASAKPGPGVVSPWRHPDCAKFARSTADGHFTLPNLASDHVFRLLVAAPGLAPQFLPTVEPGSNPVEVTLEAVRNPGGLNGQTARGRIVGPDGQPIHGAVLEITGVALADGRRQFGGLRDTDTLGVSDENGEFVLTSGMLAVALSGRVSARGFANQSIYLETGKTHALTLASGATVTGRVISGGRPLPGVTIAVSPHDRAAGSFVGDFEIATDAEGRFALTPLPPKTDYYLYGKMESVGRHGSIPSRSVHVGRDGTTTDIGDLIVQPALKLSGRVILPDGAPIPEKSRMLVGRDGISDLLWVELPADGRFDLQGIPAGIVTLATRVNGFRISSKNASYEAGNQRLVGKLESDLSGLELLLEARPPFQNPIPASSISRRPPDERPQDRPLHGVEAVK